MMVIAASVIGCAVHKFNVEPHGRQSDQRLESPQELGAIVAELHSKEGAREPFEWRNDIDRMLRAQGIETMYPFKSEEHCYIRVHPQHAQRAMAAIRLHASVYRYEDQVVFKQPVAWAK